MSVARNSVFAAAMLAAAWCTGACSNREPAPPTLTAGANPDRIVLSPGATSAVFQGTMPPAGVRRYDMPLVHGATLVVRARAADRSALAVAVVLNGTTVKGQGEAPGFWHGIAPIAGDLSITVAGAAGTTYELDVRQPRRMLLDQATRSAIVGATILPNAEIDYVLAATAGQRLTVELKAPSAAPSLVITRLSDGGLLPPTQAAAGIFEGALDAAGDYMISVVGGATPTDITLNVSLR